MALRHFCEIKLATESLVENRTFSQVVGDSIGHDEIQPNQAVEEYVRNGLYSQLIAHFLSLFDRDKIHLQSAMICKHPNYIALKLRP